MTSNQYSNAAITNLCFGTKEHTMYPIVGEERERLVIKHRVTFTNQEYYKVS